MGGGETISCDRLSKKSVKKVMGLSHEIILMELSFQKLLGRCIFKSKNDFFSPGTSVSGTVLSSISKKYSKINSAMESKGSPDWVKIDWLSLV